MPSLYNGIQYYEGTFQGGYHLVVIDRKQNPSLHVGIRRYQTPTLVHQMMKQENALIAAEGIFWEYANPPAHPSYTFGDVLANGVLAPGPLCFKRYLFAVTTNDEYLEDNLDVVGRCADGSQKYGISADRITRYKLKHAFGGIVRLIETGRPQEPSRMAAFTEKSRYIIDAPQMRVAYGWSVSYLYFMIVATKKGVRWTATQTRDFFVQEAPRINGRYYTSGAVMPDTGSFSYVMKWIDRTKEPTQVNVGAGPTGVRPQNFANISFLVVTEI